MRISLEDLQVDMVLAEDIRDPGGQLLVPAGMSVTEKHLRILEMIGIREAEVEGDDHETSELKSLDPVKLAEVEERLRPIYRHTDLTHPVIEALFRHCCHAEAKRG